MAEFVRQPRSSFIKLRNLNFHIRTWGNPLAKKLFLLHGWMDVSASFQFLVDALENEWYVIAPDLRGYGETQWSEQGYVFADYVADLEALLDFYESEAPANLLGHSLGGNIACLYAGIRPHRVRRVVSLEGFGLPRGQADQAPQRYAAWLDALRKPSGFAPYHNLAAVADRLQKNNPRLSRARAEFLASYWAKGLPDGTAVLKSDPRHKWPFPTVYRLEEVFACWRQVKAPVLWVAAAESTLRQWLNETEEQFSNRQQQFCDFRMVTIDGAGHMLHHDQPEAVAASIESFMCADEQ